jgi:hypothetical protein
MVERGARRQRLVAVGDEARKLEVADHGLGAAAVEVLHEAARLAIRRSNTVGLARRPR